MALLGATLSTDPYRGVCYRMHLEARGLAANTINQQLAAVRWLADETPMLGY